jgi:hypothetical protein
MAAYVFLDTFIIARATEEQQLMPEIINSRVEVTSYEIEGGYLEAGKETTVKVTLKNENKYFDARNLVISVSSISGMIYPKSGSTNRIFVGDIEDNDTVTVDIPLVVASELTSEYVDLNCELTYGCGDFKLSNMVSMMLPTHKIAAITVNSLGVSNQAMLNGNSLLSISYSNTSTTNISDAVIIVDGKISENTQKIDLGIIAADKSYTKDFNIIFTEPGEQSISIKLKYTNVNGESIETELGSFNVNVVEENDLVINSHVANPSLVWMGRGLALAAFLVAAFATIVYIRKR